MNEVEINRVDRQVERPDGTRTVNLTTHFVSSRIKQKQSSAFREETNHAGVNPIGRSKDLTAQDRIANLFGVIAQGEVASGKSFIALF